jgi:hypothetical protein
MECHAASMQSFIQNGMPQGDIGLTSPLSSPVLPSIEMSQHILPSMVYYF